MALYALAQVGGFIAFVPLLQMLVPIRAETIDLPHGAALLSKVAIAGAITASIANIVFGALSDRTRTEAGRRRPWLFAGLAGTLGSYAVIFAATTPSVLLGGVVAFQCAFNALFAPLGAVLADDVPDRQKGMMSALLGFGSPLGSLIGLGVVGAWLTGEPARFAGMAALVAACILPFAWRLKGTAALPQPREKAAGQWLAPLRDGNFVAVWVSRLLVVTALSMVQGYLLFYLQRRAAWLPGRPETGMAQLAAIVSVSNVGSGLLGGVLSDRQGRRVPFAVAGAMFMAAGLGAVALASSWHAMQASMLVYGAGTGLYTAIDLVLMVNVISSPQRAGRDLGILNLSNTLAQVIAPLLALLILTDNPASFRTLFLVAGLLSLGGALSICALRNRN